jgi:mRNA-degrading endonuclease RelE of RelBE toxin-antitoxin system
MNYKITIVESFKKELKSLSRRYKNIKKDYQNLLELLSTSNPKEIATYLGNNCYKIRIQNSDNNRGKSAGYRVIYLLIEEDIEIVLLCIYSKSDIGSISQESIDKKLMEIIAQKE